MPTVAALTGISDGDPADIEYLYLAPTTGGIYWPGETQTFEVLHGGLDDTNLASGTRLEPGLVQTGAMVYGTTVYFQDFNWVYASQISDTQGSSSSRITLVQVALEFDLPWEAGLVFVQWQVLLQQDATWWDYGGPNEAEEFWDIRTKLNGTDLAGGMSGVLPATRGTIDAADLSPLVNEPGFSSEGRWRWMQGMTMRMNVSKGKYHLVISAATTTLSPDQLQQKLAQACGSIVVFAIR